MNNKTTKVCIIGAGPCGATCAIYLKRANIDFVLFGIPFESAISSASSVNNYPPFRDISGSNLANEFYNNLVDNHIDINFSHVTSIKQDGTTFSIEAEDGIYKCDAVVIATGTDCKTLSVKGEKELIGKGISFCAICDGALYKNKVVAVVGGGNSAIREASYLCKIAQRVFVIHRRNVFRCDNIYYDELLNFDNVNFLTPYTVEEFKNDGDKINVFLKNIGNGEKNNITLDAVFEYIGRIPRTGMIKDTKILNKNGYVKTDKEMKTSIPGMFAGGDVTDRHIKQVAIAVGDGVICADSVINYLRERNN